MNRREDHDRGHPFPQHRAFVLQFSADSDADSGRLEGRVEHIATGERAPFRSPEDLWAFVRKVLFTPELRSTGWRR